MWKPELNNKTLHTRLPPMEGQQKKIQLLGKDCEVEKMMRFLREIEMLEKL